MADTSDKLAALPPGQIASSLDECFCHCFKGCDDCAMTDRDPILEDCAGNLAEMAVDLIRAQAKRIAELESERRWIPVVEKLPEDWADVLVRLQCGDGVVAVKSGPIWRARWTNTRLDRDPTHWMPLPQPPKGE